MTTGSPGGQRAETGSGGFRVCPCGDGAVCIELGDRVDAGLHSRIIALDKAIASQNLPGVLETVPTYRSLLVHVDPVQVDHQRLAETARILAERPAECVAQPVRWRVPVLYGGMYGVDLSRLAAERGMTPGDFAALHASVVYRVFMIGFMPGFAYLGGLDSRLAAPRRQVPRSRVPAGSIAIGGIQTSIGSLPAPSGWHLIGRTPVRCFQADRVPPFLFEAGHEVVFDPASESEWEAMDAAARKGEPIAERIVP